MIDIELFILIAFLAFAIIDLKYGIVKNEMIILSLIIYIALILVDKSSQIITSDIFEVVSVFIISQVVFLFLSIIIDMPFGDAKLIGLYLATLGINDGLLVICIGSIFSLLPLSLITNKVPMAPFFFIGYLIHFFLIKGVI